MRQCAPEAPAHRRAAPNSCTGIRPPGVWALIAARPCAPPGAAQTASFRGLSERHCHKSPVTARQMGGPPNHTPLARPGPAEVLSLAHAAVA
jgi:hypothetical protein